MQLIDGIRYNLRGLKIGFRTPKLLILGLLRFIVVILVAIVLGSIILLYHQDIISMIWSKPESYWIVWLWYLVSWLTGVILIIISTVISYLLSQIVFAVVIMDWMSRITEGLKNGTVTEQNFSYFKQLVFLIKQEIPRAIIPVMILLIFSVIGWLTPFGPVLTVISSIIAAAFLSWDNTDLAPARRFFKFNERFGFFIKNFSFHIGFGLLFLIPLFNILSLSFAPVGATLYYLDRTDYQSTISNRPSQDPPPDR
ncbi:MAG: EI24 domain-containing protein [Deltaproteobacteria bacterium]|nr:EI24 domain-containing protein [Deltaproteobacteria bacterium]